MLGEPELTDKLEIVSGRVVYHGDDGDGAYEALRRVESPNAAIWFLGPAIPEGTIAVL